MPVWVKNKTNATLAARHCAGRAFEFATGIPHLLKGEYSDDVGTGIDTYSLRQPLGERKRLFRQFGTVQRHENALKLVARRFCGMKKQDGQGCPMQQATAAPYLRPVLRLPLSGARRLPIC